MEDIQASIQRMNEGYRRLAELRKEYNVKPGESLFKAMFGVDPPWSDAD